MAVQAKPAASILAYYQDGQAFRFLMGRRSAQHKFMPGVYVFPGGKVDAEDVASACQKFDVLHGAWLDKLDCAVDGFVNAAIRELYEETGYHLNDKPALGGQTLVTTGPISLIGRAITPSYCSIRYDTLFFGCQVEKPVDSQPIPNSAELENVGWFSEQDLKALSVAGITQFIFDHGLAYAEEGNEVGFMDAGLR